MSSDRQIRTVIQRGRLLLVYGERNQTLFTIGLDVTRGDVLHGYTNSSVTVRKNGRMYTYNNMGRMV